jgi:hypothetical protein
VFGCYEEVEEVQYHPESSLHTQHTRDHADMDKPNSALFDVFLRLRPSDAARERFLDVDRNTSPAAPTHITIKPPVDDKRKRAVERFGFTRVFEEDAGQLELFRGTGAVSMIEGVLGARGREGRDGVLATLGVTGSGKVCREEDDVRTDLLADFVLTISAEPHYPGLQVPARPHTAHPGHAVPEHSALPCQP